MSISLKTQGDTTVREEPKSKQKSSNQLKKTTATVYWKKTTNNYLT